jgi:hypothetical protein
LDKKLAFNPKSELFALKLEKCEKFLYAFLLGLSCMFGISAYQFHNTNKEIKNDIILLQHKASMIERKLKELQAPLRTIQLPSKDMLDQTTRLSKDIKKAILSPRIVEIWNELASITPEQCKIGALELKFSDDKVTINLEGVIINDVVKTQSIFTSYLSSIEKKHYIIQNKKIQLSLDNNMFKLTLIKQLAHKIH